MSNDEILSELKKITGLLTKAPPGITPPKGKNWTSDPLTQELWETEAIK